MLRDKQSPRSAANTARAKTHKNSATILTPAVIYDNPVEGLIDRLDRVKPTGPGKYQARCPAHDDRSPSLSIRELDDGTVLVRCWAGCGAADIVAAVGLTLADLFPRRFSSEHRSPSRPRINPRDVLQTAITEAIIIGLGYRDLAEGRPLDQADTARVELAIETVNRLNTEVGHGYR